MPKGIVTINTDAGFYPNEKIGSYAFCIKGDDLFLKGSGIFKELCKNSLDAEMKAIINALHVLKASGYKAEKIVVNRDNINAKSGKQSELQTKMSKIIRQIKIASISRSHPNYTGEYVSFRHVKAHKHTNNKRHWVNDWCDNRCKVELRNYKLKMKKERGVETPLD